MNIRLFVVSLTALGLAAGAASATARHDMRSPHHRFNSYSQFQRKEAQWAKTYAMPARPIPYAELDAYLRGDRAQKAEMMASANGPN